MILNKKLLKKSLLVFWIPSVAWAQTGGTLPEADLELGTIEVRDSKMLRDRLWLDPDAQKGPAIRSGKKITLQDQTVVPAVPLQNYRYQFARTPGLIASEVGNESFVSMGLRGLGDPHETQNLLLLEDGIPLSADLYGYPAHYYQPPFEWVETTELIRGGAALMYGPLPAGAVSYRMRGARLGLNRAQVDYRLGSFDFQNIQGESNVTLGERDALLLQFKNKSSDGWRNRNSGFDSTQARAQWLHSFSGRESLRVTLNASSSVHGESGGLALTSSAGVLGMDQNWRQNTLNQDTLRLERWLGVIHWERPKFDLKIFGGQFDRDSFRQDLGGAPAFGGVPLANTNTIQRQGFRTLGLDVRQKFEEQFLGTAATTSIGMLAYAVDSPFLQESGASARARSGSATKNLDRKTRVVSVFAERKQQWGEFSITPGIRVENIYQSIRENLNVGSAVPLRSSEGWDHVALLGLGSQYRFDSVDTFINFSQAYKPQGFQDTVPLQTGDVVSGDLNPARTWTVELGAQSRDSALVSWKASVFWIRYSDQFGRVGNVLQNTGAAEHQGGEVELSAPIIESPVELVWSGNASLLFARFTEGSLNGKTPQYAPRWTIKNSLILQTRVWSSKAPVRLALTQQFLSEHFGDDGNSANRKIPSFQVFDLTADAPVGNTPFKLFLGVQNLFDRQYYSRVRSNGIEPAAPRQWTFGVSAEI